MRRSPIVAGAITVTLALGIGANLVMFGIADRLLFSPPTGVLAADELRLLDLPQGGNYPRSTVSNYATFRDLSAVESFASVGAYGFSADQSLGRGARAEKIVAAPASASFFSTLGTRPIAGRLFTASEDQPPRGVPVAVISAEYWQMKFGRSASAIGATLDINDRLYRIVGVLPPHFTGLDLKPVDVWLPLTDQSFSMNPDYQTDRGSKWMMIVARLKPGSSEGRAIAESSRLFALTNPDTRPIGITTIDFKSVIPGKNAGTGADAARVSIWLVGVAAIVLLIACANVATLLLTRAMRRTPEIAVRLALGVSRRRLVMQMLVEASLFAVIGGVVAILAAYLSRGFIQSVLLPDTDLGPALSPATLALGVGIIAFICGLTSIAPALQVLRVDLATSLKGASGKVSDGRNRVRASLLVAQVAMSAVLLVGAGLFVRSLENARNTRLGIDVGETALAEVAVHSVGYDFNRTKQFWTTAVNRVRAVPGVGDAALTIGIPMRFSIGGRFRVPGLDRLPPMETGGPYRNGVDEHFFPTLGARIVRGRSITAADLLSTEKVVVINETLARQIASAGEALGRCVMIWRDSIPCARIVGVVEDVSRHGVGEKPSMQYYVPWTQWEGQHSLAMIVRARDGRADAIAAPVTRALQEIAPDVPFPRVNSFDRLRSPQLKAWRLGATMFSLFGALAFIVSVVGLYGLLTYGIEQRQQEFGIRAALGAQSADIIRIVLKSGLVLVSVGLMIGLSTAAGVARYVGPMLYKVPPRDMLAYAASAGIVLVVTALVTIIPARRASAVAPTTALRSE
jgi:predicted permease